VPEAEIEDVPAALYVGMLDRPGLAPVARADAERGVDHRVERQVPLPAGHEARVLQPAVDLRQLRALGQRRFGANPLVRGHYMADIRIREQPLCEQ
jgi:hypothetical protein